MIGLRVQNSFLEGIRGVKPQFNRIVAARLLHHDIIKGLLRSLKYPLHSLPMLGEAPDIQLRLEHAKRSLDNQLHQDETILILILLDLALDAMQHGRKDLLAHSGYQYGVLVSEFVLHHV